MTRKSIVFQVWDHDLGKDEPLGEVNKNGLRIKISILQVQVPLWNRGNLDEFSETQDLSAITNDGTAKKKVLTKITPSHS